MEKIKEVETCIPDSTMEERESNICSGQFEGQVSSTTQEDTLSSTTVGNLDSVDTLLSTIVENLDSVDTLLSTTVENLESVDTLSSTTVENLESVDTLSSTTVENLESVDTLSSITVDNLESVDTLSSTTVENIDSVDTLSSTTVENLDSVDTLSSTTVDNLESVDTLSSTTVDNLESVDTLSSTTVENLESVDTLSSTTVDNLESVDTLSSLTLASQDIQDDCVDTTSSDDGYISSGGIESEDSSSADCSEPYEIRSIPGKGKGMFATRKIFPGEIILTEVPLIILADDIFIDPEKCERFLDKEVDKMPMHQRQRFLSLSDGRDPENPTYLGRFYTNDMDWDGDVCLCPTMARVNHACAPNADFITRQDKGEQRLVAISIIQPEDEITICYLPSADEGTDIRRVRQDYLLSLYGFRCTCKQCNLEGEDLEANEEVREEIKELQSVGLHKLQNKEIEQLFECCMFVTAKPTYLLQLTQALYNNNPNSQVDKYIQSLRGYVIAMTAYGEDSTQAQLWKERIEIDEFQALQMKILPRNS